MYEHLAAIIENLDELLDTPTDWDLWEDEEVRMSTEKENRIATLMGMQSGGS